MSMRTMSRGGLVLGAFAVIGLSACAPKVTRTDFESEVAKIRDEMQTGDRQLGKRRSQSRGNRCHHSQHVVDDLTSPV